MKTPLHVFINAGHNPTHPTDPDPGAPGFGVWEADIVRDIAPQVIKYLEVAGVIVVGSMQAELCDVVQTANATNADLFVSLHCNSADSSASGTETFYCLGSTLGKKYARIMQKQLIDSLHTVDRGIKDDTQSAVGRLYVLRNTTMPAILIEIAFISNYDDNQLLINQQDTIARAIARGITDIGQEM